MRHHNLTPKIMDFGILLVLFFSTIRVANADFVFGPAENSGPLINTSVSEIEPVPEPLELWFSRRLGATDWDEWKVSRPTSSAVRYGPSAALALRQ